VSPICFISAGIGGWYPRGVERLKKSLATVGYTGDVQIWKNQWPEWGHPKHCVYAVKAAAFDWAIKQGYTTIIWADASMTVQRPVEPLIEAINRKGYWIGQSGFNGAQTCSDACLQYFDITRDEAEQMKDSATGLFGVNTTFLKARVFIEKFIQAGRDQAFNGSRLHANQSKDPRFLFHRQDQACATVILGKLGMSLDLFQDFVQSRWYTPKGDMFRCEPMV
jgi:hypothetical protein